MIPTPPFSHHLKALGTKFKSASNRTASIQLVQIPTNTHRHTTRQSSRHTSPYRRRSVEHPIIRPVRGHSQHKIPTLHPKIPQTIPGNYTNYYPRKPNSQAMPNLPVRPSQNPVEPPQPIHSERDPEASQGCLGYHRPIGCQ